MFMTIFSANNLIVSLLPFCPLSRRGLAKTFYFLHVTLALIERCSNVTLLWICHQGVVLGCLLLIFIKNHLSHPARNTSLIGSRSFLNLSPGIILITSDVKWIMTISTNLIFQVKACIDQVHEPVSFVYSVQINCKKLPFEQWQKKQPNQQKISYVFDADTKYISSQWILHAFIFATGVASSLFQIFLKKTRLWRHVCAPCSSQSF